jgi:predicted ABC-type transport system involved in lysophospholipase L1 biosynthesis ATPase subunit
LVVYWFQRDVFCVSNEEDARRVASFTIEIMHRPKLQQVGPKGFENYTPAQLSGGMKKRAAVVRALAMDPDILGAPADPSLTLQTGPPDTCVIRFKK